MQSEYVLEFCTNQGTEPNEATHFELDAYIVHYFNLTNFNLIFASNKLGHWKLVSRTISRTDSC